ncbi:MULTISPECIES: DUF4192 domain-containing protein [unclassified Streptomyces]|uniref:DUF4192 domain-containing protein n=1 Tax=unclassified Streptomyces TaxID=2593676 RepID=UPI00048A8E07|nr:MULTISPECIES: DUF4192 domain-containing protein [unclassified Streptomyces]
MNEHQESTGPADSRQITLRGPAELADALPYLMGFHPDDSVVMVALHGDRGRFGGRLRLGIPRAPGEWGPVADQLAESLIAGSERREGRPDAILIFLCQDPPDGESGRVTMERLRPFAQSLRTACGALDVPVLEALCISDGRYWSYCCPDVRCCPPEGKPLAMPGTTVMAAAAAYAGIQVRGTLRDMEARLTPWQTPDTAAAQLRALDRAAPSLVARILNERAKARVAEETLTLARTLMGRLGGMRPAPETVRDVGDDRAIGDEEAAAVILGLQDRETRDKAAAWMEGPDGHHALRLWRALARRCVGPYGEHAAAPLTLAGWVSWSTGDEPGARVALTMALRADPHYTFAQLLHRACNEGLDPETLRRCLRGEAEGSAAGPGAQRPKGAKERMGAEWPGKSGVPAGADEGSAAGAAGSAEARVAGAVGEARAVAGAECPGEAEAPRESDERAAVGVPRDVGPPEAVGAPTGCEQPEEAGPGRPRQAGSAGAATETVTARGPALRVRRVRPAASGTRRRGSGRRTTGSEGRPPTSGTTRPGPAAAGRRASDIRRYDRRGTGTRR